MFSYSFFLIVSWIVWSFLFWRHLRNLAIAEEQIFDTMFYATIVAFATSRMSFVFTHFPLFRDNLLRIFALWLQPGLSLTGGLVGAIIVIVFMAFQRNKTSIASLLDAFSQAFAWASVVGYAGSFLDGTTIGKIAGVPWAVQYVGSVGRRHPVELYMIVALLCIILCCFFAAKKVSAKKAGEGSVAMIFFALYAIAFFVIEFFTESDVYWGSLSANQWIMVLVFSQSLGAFYVQGGGKEQLVRVTGLITQRINNVIGGLYDRISKRRSG